MTGCTGADLSVVTSPSIKGSATQRALLTEKADIMGKQDGPVMGTGRAVSMHNVTVVLKQHWALCPPLRAHTHARA